MSTDHRLTAFDAVTRKPGWLGLGLGAWVILTGAGGYRLLARRWQWKEARA